MKFNIKSLEEKLNNITNESKEFTKTIQNNKNKKTIELIIFTFMSIISYDYHLQKKAYLEFINRFSQNYLLGDKRYNIIGEDFTFQDYYNELDESLKYKINGFLFFMSFLYNSLS